MRKRILSIMLILAMFMSMFSFGTLQTVSAEGTGECPHHVEHTEECGYIPANEEEPCTHEHTEECLGLDGNCTHEHDENCGYVEATEGSLCGYVCDICGEESNDVAEESGEVVLSDDVEVYADYSNNAIALDNITVTQGSFGQLGGHPFRLDVREDLDWETFGYDSGVCWVNGGYKSSGNSWGVTGYVKGWDSVDGGYSMNADDDRNYTSYVMSYSFEGAGATSFDYTLSSYVYNYPDYHYMSGLVIIADKTVILLEEDVKNGTVSYEFKDEGTHTITVLYNKYVLSGYGTPPSEYTATISNIKVATDSVAKITKSDGSEVTYFSLQGAVDAVEDNETITLLTNVTENIVSSNKSYTLDMANHTIDGNKKDSVYRITDGNVTFKNGTLTNGYAPDTGKKYDDKAYGGGICALGSSNIALEDVTITNNYAYAGGGIYFTTNSSSQSKLIIKNSKIINNEAECIDVNYGGGGGLYIDVSSNVEVNISLEKVDFEGNQAVYGAAMYSKGAFNASNCTFTKNYSDLSDDSSIIEIRNDVTRVFKDCKIMDNYNTDYIICVAGSNELTFNNCIVSNNIANKAGGFYLTRGNLVLNDTIIKENTAKNSDLFPVGRIDEIYPAGGIVQYEGTLTFNSGAIYDNKSGNDANDIYILKGATFYLMAASTMEDSERNDISFSKYVFEKSNGDLIRRAMSGIQSEDLFLTAVEDDTPTVNSVFMSGTGDNDNNGEFKDPVETFERAKEILGPEGGIIYLTGSGINVDNNQEWDGDGIITVMRYSDNDDINKANMILINDGGQLTLRDIIIDGGSGGSYYNCGSIINVSMNGELIIENGAVLQNNDIRDRNDSTVTKGGAIYSKGSVIMNSGTIQNCAALLGGGIFCDNSRFIMQGGTIANNKAGSYKKINASIDGYNGSGGGVMINGSVPMIMTGGTFSGNQADNAGGGISLGSTDTSASGQSAISIIGKANSNKTSYASRALNSQILFTQNTAENGGGLFVQCSYEINIYEGDFTENNANGGQFGGGAIYVNGGRKDYVDGVGRIYNVLITDNYADSAGGGIAACGTSTTSINITDGSVIYNNHSDKVSGEGERKDDIRVATGTDLALDMGSKQHRDHVSPYMLDGTPYRWKSVTSTNNAFVREDSVYSLTGKHIYTDATPSIDINDSNIIKVRITENHSNKGGGGIGSNGIIYIGGESGKEQINVSKKWEGLNDGEDYPDNLVQLYAWLLRIDPQTGHVEHVEHQWLFHKVVGPNRITWNPNTSFTDLLEGYEYVVVEEALFDDGTHVWSSNGHDYEDAIKDIMKQNYFNEDGTFIWSDDSGSPFYAKVVDDGNSNFIFTNKMGTGDLSVEKKVTGTTGETNKDFHFIITLSDKTVDGRFGHVEFKNGMAELTLKHGEKIVATGLPIDVKYTVVEREANQDGYTTTWEGHTGTITKDVTKTVKFINHKDRTLDKGDLEVSKIVTGNAGNIHKKFHFIVELSDTTINGIYGDMTFKNGVAELTLKHKESKKATDLPADIAYEVKEIEANTDGYVTTSTNASGTITKEGAQVEFINHKDAPTSSKTATLIIYKIDQDEDFLEGAGFELIQVTDEGQHISLKKLEGLPKFEFTGLEEGHYIINEYRTPDGYEGIGTFEIDVIDGEIYYAGESYDSLAVMNTNDGTIPKVLGDQIEDQDYIEWYLEHYGKQDEEAKKVKTSDTTPILGYITLGIVSLIVAIIVKRRESQE